MERDFMDYDLPEGTEILTLQEVSEIYGDGYDYDEESLLEDYNYEEILKELNYSEVPDGSREREYKPGDVVTSNTYSGNSVGQTGKHYIMVIDSRDKDSDGVIHYKGFMISTRVEKSNLVTSKYPNNLFIDDTRSIFQGRCYLTSKPALIRVDDIVTFTSEDIVPSKAYKGHVSTPFWRFVIDARRNYDTHNQSENSAYYWKDGKPVIGRRDS